MKFLQSDLFRKKANKIDETKDSKATPTRYLRTKEDPGEIFDKKFYGDESDKLREFTLNSIFDDKLKRVMEDEKKNKKKQPL